MVKQRRLGFAVITSLLLIIVSACQSSEAATEEQPTPSAPTSIRRVPGAESPSPSPSPSEQLIFPPPEPGESADITAVREAWQTYEETIDKYARDSSLKNLDELTFLTTGDETFEIVHSLGRLRDANLVWVGNAQYSSLSIDEPSVRNDGVRVATVTVCKDFSELQLVDEKTGQAPKDQPDDYFASKLTSTTFFEQAPNGKWLASGGSGEDGCE
uniref:hypothetical protein n=1 Tax=Tessaracoccus timonensis TaxID=2161816 RepID=UPI000D553176|nr:hypothetical protein [Tessaracoccus timonensis]